MDGGDGGDLKALNRPTIASTTVAMAVTTAQIFVTKIASFPGIN
jgi:hypothetical protein